MLLKPYLNQDDAYLFYDNLSFYFSRAKYNLEGVIKYKCTNESYYKHYMYEFNGYMKFIKDLIEKIVTIPN